jgi:hypothetical protein
MEKVSLFALSCAPLAGDAVHLTLVDKSCTESILLSSLSDRYLIAARFRRLLECTEKWIAILTSRFTSEGCDGSTLNLLDHA